MMELDQHHLMLYDKSCEDYNKKEGKKQHYQQKALELGVEGSDDEPGQGLQTWVKTHRDKFGRQEVGQLTEKSIRREMLYAYAFLSFFHSFLLSSLAPRIRTQP